MSEDHNSVAAWDALWSHTESAVDRASRMAIVYERIKDVVGSGKRVIDLAGGAGALALMLDAEVWDHSEVALAYVRGHGLPARLVNLRGELPVLDDKIDVFVGTEILEHLDESVRERVVRYAADNAPRAVFSVPNNCLGPDEEPQHCVRYTALEFKRYLHRFYADVRVECIKHYLVGFCGWPKSFTMSYATPARDEAHDIERVLKSMRGIADEMVVGIDPRTKDNTREIAERYAEVVFDLVDPQGPPEERQPETGVHFAWIRNQCLDKCTSDWIFMTEAHEHLEEGADIVLRLPDVIPADTPVCFVLRRLGEQQWGFPWLFKRDKGIRFARHTHNTLEYPSSCNAIRLPQVIVRHDRHEENRVQRFEQRKTQNRRSLRDDWLLKGSKASLFYLASEWRDFDRRRTVELLREFLRLESRGPRAYQARLVLARECAIDNNAKEAREILFACVGDDWSRTEHWIWLGDLAWEAGHPEEAYRYYRYASCAIGRPPFTLWWIDLPYYSYLPAQRMAMICAEMGQIEDALAWAQRVVELLPKDAPEDMHEEAAQIVALVEEMRNERCEDRGPA